MKSNSTIIWFLIAAALFGGIRFLEKNFRPMSPGIEKILPGFRASDVTSVQIIPAGEREIGVVRTNGAWQLDKPLAYPAQTAGIENFLTALQNLSPMEKLTSADLRNRANADAEFGFENPQFSIDVSAGDQQWHLRIGKKTAPGDQVFIRVVGANGAFITDAAWLQTLPRTVSDWRDTALISASENFDWIVITNGTKVIELRNDSTNHFWRMLRPLQARADNDRLNLALQQLRTARVTKFASDDPKADLTAFGLQPPDLDLWLGRETNLIAGIDAGKNLPGDPAQIFARRADWNSVVALPADVFAAWHGAVNDFRDPRLFELTSPVTEIEVQNSNSNSFTLQQRAANDWSVAGEKFPVETANVQAFVKMLGALRVSEFVKDVVTPTDLQSFGLAAPSRKIILHTTDTNDVQILFGNSETNRVFVKRADEDFIYALAPADFDSLLLTMDGGWEYRSLRAWNFSETNVASVTLRQNGQTNELVRTGKNKWSLDAGNGFINPAAVEETVHRLGELTAFGRWLDRNFSDATAAQKYKLNPDNLQITIELKTGEKFSVQFGLELPQAQTALAAVTLDGERWAFIFPPALYQLVSGYLTIPPPAH